MTKRGARVNCTSYYKVKPLHDAVSRVKYFIVETTIVRRSFTSCAPGTVQISTDTR